MRDVAPGEIGEIVHRSPHLMLGYFHDDERTKAAFEGGWFHSGDLATIDADGYIYVVDRKKDMVKTGGENVASREVEEMIYKLPQVSEVAVIGVPHPRWVEAVVAVVVVKAGQSLSKDTVHAALRRASGALQGAEGHRVRGRLAEEPERQIAQARTAPRPRGVVCVSSAASRNPDNDAAVGGSRVGYCVNSAADGSFFTCSMLSVMIFVISITDWLSAA